MVRRSLGRQVVVLLLLTATFCSTGCFLTRQRWRPYPAKRSPVPHDMPRELRKAVLPEYIIEPPDVLDIQAINLVPKAPYHLRVLDTIDINVFGTLPDAPIAGIFPIQVGGTVDLGFTYGEVKVTGLTPEEAKRAIHQHLLKHLRAPEVTVKLGAISAQQTIEGEHPVAYDGRVTLANYGRVLVTGKTIEEAKAAIETHLSKYLQDPEVSLRVIAPSSKFFYMITQGAGLGDNVQRFPITGNETVLDVVANTGGFGPDSSKRIWIARPGCNSDGCDQILNVDWRAISQLGQTCTNFQLMPGDRLYVAERQWIRFDNDLNRLMRPINTIGAASSSIIGIVSQFSGNVLGGGAQSQFGQIAGSAGQAAAEGSATVLP